MLGVAGCCEVAVFSVPGAGVCQGCFEAWSQIGAVPEVAAGLAGTLRFGGTSCATRTGGSWRICSPSDLAGLVFCPRSRGGSWCFRGRTRMFQGRAGHLGGDANAGEELPLLRVELVVRGALTPQPVSGTGVVEVIEAVLGLKEAAAGGVPGAVVAALPVQVPGRAPPGIDVSEGLDAAGGQGAVAGALVVALVGEPLP